MSTCEEALAVVRKYNLSLSDKVMNYLSEETPKSLDNVEAVIIGSVRILCESVAQAAAGLGYTPYVLCTEMNCEAREAGRLISSIAMQAGSGDYSFKRPCALIFGGETVVNLKGKGKGGRNQELALASAEGIAGTDNTVIFSFGSDGTDGPTDAAGGFADGGTLGRLREKRFNIHEVLDNNDSYKALAAVNGLIKTGPTGTNVNDVAVVLCG